MICCASLHVFEKSHFLSVFESLPPPPLTLKSSHAAGHKDSSMSLSLHVWKEGLYGAESAQQIDVQDCMYSVQWVGF